MWAFGPAQTAVARHLATFNEWPPVTPDTGPEIVGGVGNLPLAGLASGFFFITLLDNVQNIIGFA